EREVERGRDLHAVRGGQGERLLLGQHEPLGRRVVADVAARGLPFQPFRGVSLADSGLLGDLGRGRGHDGQERPVEPQTITDHRVDRVETSAEIGDETAEQLVQCAFVDGHDGLLVVADPCSDRRAGGRGNYRDAPGHGWLVRPTMRPCSGQPRDRVHSGVTFPSLGRAAAARRLGWWPRTRPIPTNCSRATTWWRARCRTRETGTTTPTSRWWRTPPSWSRTGSGCRPSRPS